mgnify:CR=1 FL=1
MVGSAAEAGVAATHMNAEGAATLRQCPGELGHPQPATRIRTGNAAAEGFVDGATKQKRSKTFDSSPWKLMLLFLYDNEEEEVLLFFHEIDKPLVTRKKRH